MIPPHFEPPATGNIAPQTVTLPPPPDPPQLPLTHMRSTATAQVTPNHDRCSGLGRSGDHGFLSCERQLGLKRFHAIQDLRRFLPEKNSWSNPPRNRSCDNFSFGKPVFAHFESFASKNTYRLDFFLDKAVL